MDVHCRICGEPWDIWYDAGPHSDMSEDRWMTPAFLRGAGCEACGGVKPDGMSEDLEVELLKSWFFEADSACEGDADGAFGSICADSFPPWTPPPPSEDHKRFISWLDDTVRGGHLDMMEVYCQPECDKLYNLDNGEWFEVETGGFLSFGRCWYDRKFYPVPLATFSDYSGCSVERSNARVLNDDESLSPYLSTRYGAYGTEWLGFWLEDLRALYDDAEALECLEGTFRALAGYPVLDDDDLCEVEIEAEDEAWNCWAGSDFENALESRLEELIEIPDDEFVELDPVRVHDLFSDTCDSICEYWVIETGGGAYIDVDRVVNAISDHDLVAWYLGNDE